jgi:hypothetical protein
MLPHFTTSPNRPEENKTISEKNIGFIVHIEPIGKKQITD